MIIRNAKFEELDEIKKIYNKAKSFMDDSGNAGQWVNDYPQKTLLAEDIKNKSLFVCLDNNKIVAVFCFLSELNQLTTNITKKWWKIFNIPPFLFKYHSTNQSKLYLDNFFFAPHKVD